MLLKPTPRARGRLRPLLLFLPASLLLLGMVIALVAADPFGIPQVNAAVEKVNPDYAMNFDNFGVGTQNPFPWTFNQGSGTSCSGCGEVASNWTAHSVPNLYIVSGIGKLFSHSPQICATFHAP